MPYLMTVCRACDMLVQTAGPHGCEDEYCEGEEGYERITLWTDQEVSDGRAASALATVSSEDAS